MLRVREGKWHQASPMYLENGLYSCRSQGGILRRVNNLQLMCLRIFSVTGFTLSDCGLFACLLTRNSTVPSIFNSSHDC